MPIFFEKRQRGEDPILSIYGTKDELGRLVSDLKERLALRELHHKPDPNLGVPNLKSTSFADVEVLVVTEEEAERLKKSDRRKHYLTLAIWLLIVGAIVVLFLFGGKKG